MDLLSKQFEEGKLSSPVKLKLGQLLAGNVIPLKMYNTCHCLIAAIELEDYKAAEGIHVGLMVDHVSEVSSWMVGVKKLLATHKSAFESQSH